MSIGTNGAVLAGEQSPPPKFWAVGKLADDFRPKMQNLGLKTHFGQI